MKTFTILIFCSFFLRINCQDEFTLCDSNNWQVYYAKEHGKDRYRTESKIVKEFIKKQFKYQCDTSQNGFITFRYFVNCKGKAGKFSIIQVDNNYNKYSFKQELVSQLENIVTKLDIYKVKTDFRKGREHILVDYFIFLSFKIRNGEIEAILP